MDDLIRVRACLAVVDHDRLLLVPHYDTDVGAVQWVVPGGRIEFGESLREAATREFLEETGIQAEVTRLLDVSEVILPKKPYHSITVSFSGRIGGGHLRPEPSHRYGKKTPRWMSINDVLDVMYHPPQTVEKALGITQREADRRRGLL